MKANPYVYPYIPFEDLSKKTINWQLTEPKKVTFEELNEQFLKKLSFPIAKTSGKTVDEKILNIFLDKNILYGAAENILADKQTWLQKINYFTSKNKPVLFTVHGFPFKIPNPLKTDRQYPDLGETLALLKLNSIIEGIEKVYQPAAKITIIGEGGFAKFVGVSEAEWQGYRNFLLKIIKNLNLENKISVVDIADLEKDENFKKVFDKIKRNLKNLYNSGDETTVKKVDGTFDAVLRIVSTKKYPEEKLFDIYNDKVNTPEIVKIKDKLKKAAFDSIFDYHAYLMTRDELDFVNKKVPNSLPLTVSPKRGRLGIFPISPECDRLPYHGVPLFDQSKKDCSIVYLVDIKRKKQTYTPVILKNDPDSAPFFYIVQ